MAKKKRKNSRGKRKNPDAKVVSGYQRLCEKASHMYGSDFLVAHSPDGIKMSEVMQDFIEPYLGDDITKDKLAVVMHMALFAWNGAMASEQMRKELVSKLRKDFPEDIREKVLEMLEHMMDRKQRFFSDCTRFVYSFEIVEKKNSYQLLVASMPGL